LQDGIEEQEEGDEYKVMGERLNNHNLTSKITIVNVFSECM
jgi:hypothetical protein